MGRTIPHGPILLSAFIILSGCLVVSGMMLTAVDGFHQSSPQGTASSLFNAMDEVAKLGTSVLFTDPRTWGKVLDGVGPGFVNEPGESSSAAAPKADDSPELDSPKFEETLDFDDSIPNSVNGDPGDELPQSDDDLDRLSSDTVQTLGETSFVDNDQFVDTHASQQGDYDTSTEHVATDHHLTESGAAELLELGFHVQGPPFMFDGSSSSHHGGTRINVDSWNRQTYQAGDRLDTNLGFDHFRDVANQVFSPQEMLNADTASVVFSPASQEIADSLLEEVTSDLGPECATRPLASSNQVELNSSHSVDGGKSSRPYTFTCEFCPQETFPRKRDFTNHYATVHGLHGCKAYRCSEPGCNSAFHWPKDLYKHNTRHTGDRKYVCSLCRSTFTRRDNMNRHVIQMHAE